MKTIVLLILCSALVATVATGQAFRGAASSHVPIEYGSVLDVPPEDIAAEQRSEALNRDPWRIINGVTNRIDLRWPMFGGQILEVQSGGVRVSGSFWNQSMAESGQTYNGEFFVAHFPYHMAEGETIPPNTLFAMPAGTYSYTTVMGGSRTIRKLNYGILWHPDPPKPLTHEQIAAENKRLDAHKKAAEAKALKFNQDAADRGDAYGLLRMGERYRNGDGVGKDLAKAREYLTRAASAGSPTAADELKQLASQ